jgi:hypothetical protein
MLTLSFLGVLLASPICFLVNCLAMTMTWISALHRFLQPLHWLPCASCGHSVRSAPYDHSKQNVKQSADIWTFLPFVEWKPISTWLYRVILISGFRRDVDKIFSLLGYYAASCGNCLPTFRDNVSVPYSQVNFSYSNSWPVKIGPIRWPETSVNNCHTTPRNIPGERRSQRMVCLCSVRLSNVRIASRS